MSIPVGGASGATFCDINTTPLIDVMLVLLVTLIVTLPIMTHAVKLDMPNANNPPPPPNQQPEVIDLEIDGDGTVVWNGTSVSGIPQLEGYFNAERDGPGQRGGRHNNCAGGERRQDALNLHDCVLCACGEV